MPPGASVPTPALSATPPPVSASTARPSPTAAVFRPVSAAGAKASSGAVTTATAKGSRLVVYYLGRSVTTTTRARRSKTTSASSIPLRARATTPMTASHLWASPWPVSSGRVLPIAAKPGMTIATSSTSRAPTTAWAASASCRTRPLDFWARGRLRPESFAELTRPAPGERRPRC